MSKKILALFFVVSFYLHSAGKLQAETLFQDNFDSYPNNSFPTKWVKYSPSPVPGCTSEWEVINGEFGVHIAPQSGCADNMIPINTYWPELANSYIFEVDMKFISGTDHNLAYFIEPNTNAIYELHFQSPGDFTLGGPISQYLVNIPQSYPNGMTYHIKLIVSPSNIKVFINDTLVRDAILSTPLPPGTIGLRAGVGGDPSTETWFDNVKVTTLDHEDEEEEEDEDQGLDVPLLKQTDTLWGNDIYDTAGNWSSNGVTMSDWGCAVTSASMVFQYNGLTKMQDDSELNPGSINSWLKNQPDGYVRNGLLNWIALSRLSREVSANNSVAFDALEYARHSVDDAYLTNIIENSQPAILHEPGHFIVAKGVSEEDSTFWINDPYFEINKLSDSKYSNSYAKIGTYTPVNSDLSYMMLVVDSHVEITLLDPVGDQVGEIELEEPISDPENDSNNNVGSLKILYLPKPESGEYELNLSSTTGGSYVLDQYYYDENGEVHVITSTGLLDEGDTNIYLVNYDKDEISNTTSEMLTDEEVTFESIRQKIKDGYKDKKIKFGTYIVLLVELEIAERAKKVKISQGSLNLMVHTLKRDKRIDDDFKSELIEDIQALKDNL